MELTPNPAPSPNNGVNSGSADRTHSVREYLRVGEGFVCDFARRALSKGLVHIAELPSLTPSVLAAYQTPLQIRQDAICTHLAKLVRGNAKACVLIEPDKVDSEKTGFEKAWEFYREAFIALKRLEIGPRLNPNALRSDVQARADYFSAHDHKLEFSHRGLLSFKGAGIHLITMSDVYDQKFSRWAPETIYVLNWYKEVNMARQSDPAVIGRMIRNTFTLDGYRYQADLPWVFQRGVDSVDPLYAEARDIAIAVKKGLAIPVETISRMKRELSASYINMDTGQPLRPTEYPSDEQFFEMLSFCFLPPTM